jgi:LacI family transcriptional regulator
MFGLIVPDIANPFFPEVVKAFEFEAIQHGYEAIVANTNNDGERTVKCFRRMVERSVDGVAILASDVDPKLLTELSRRRQPVVLLDVGKGNRLTSIIQVDYKQGIQQAVQHLTTLGHKSLAYIAGPNDLRSAAIRKQAFLDALSVTTPALAHPTIIEADNTIDGGHKAMIQLISGVQRPTAIFTANDLTAFGALGAISLLGLRVPIDISVVGFDDIELSRFTQPPLTTVRLSRDELGLKAFQALYEMAKNEAGRGKIIKISSQLIVRGSTGPVRPNLLGGD